MGLGGSLRGGVVICGVTGVQRLSIRGVMRVMGVIRRVEVISVGVINIRGVERREVRRVESRGREQQHGRTVIWVRDGVIRSDNRRVGGRVGGVIGDGVRTFGERVRV